VLASGDDALLSHGNAAALWGVAAAATTLVHVTTTGRGRVEQPGIKLHRVRALHPEDRAELDGIPVTSLPRTLLDLAEVLPADRLTRVLEEADRLRLFDARALDRLCERTCGRRGPRALEAAVTSYIDPPSGTRSELERRFVALCRGAGLSPPAVTRWFVASRSTHAGRSSD
jgi:hypothetical protein